MADNVTKDGVTYATEEVTILNGAAVPAQQVQRIQIVLRTADFAAVDLPGDGTDGLRVNAATVAALLGALSAPAAGSVNAQLAAIAAAVDGLEGLTDGLEGGLASLATQATAAAILAKLSADPATQTTLAAVLAAIDGLETNTTGLATVAAQATAQTTLASILAAVDTLELLTAGPDTTYRGTTGFPVTIPLAAGERLHGVLAVPTSGGQVTVTVPTQPADQAPVDFPYSEDFKGGIVGAGNLVIAGAVAYYRVTTLTP